MLNQKRQQREPGAGPYPYWVVPTDYDDVMKAGKGHS